MKCLRARTRGIAIGVAVTSATPPTFIPFILFYDTLDGPSRFALVLSSRRGVRDGTPRASRFYRAPYARESPYIYILLPPSLFPKRLVHQIFYWRRVPCVAQSSFASVWIYVKRESKFAPRSTTTLGNDPLEEKCRGWNRCSIPPRLPLVPRQRQGNVEATRENLHVQRIRFSSFLYHE